MRFRVLLFTLILFILPFTQKASAQYSGRIGDRIDLPQPILPGGYEVLTSVYYSTSKHLEVASGTSSVYIRSFFTGHETVTCDYYCVRQYYSGDRIWEDYKSGTTYYYISCTSSPDSGPTPGSDPKPNPNYDAEDPHYYNIDYGWWGTITIKKGESKTIYHDYNIVDYSGVKSIVWSDYGSFGFDISSQNKSSCTITGRYPCSDQKLWCLMKYGNSTYKAYYSIDVIESIEPFGITMSTPVVTLTENESYTLSYSLVPTNADTNTSVTWSSDDTSIATVTSSGKISAVKPGTTFVRAKTANGKTDFCQVTVEKAPFIKALSAHLGGYHSLVVKSDGSLWSCGRNFNGQLGNGETEDRNKFVKVLNNVASVYAGEYYTLAVKNDNSLWSFGKNSYGVLGDGTNTDKHSPQKISDNVKFCIGGNSNTLYIKKDDSLWGCGRNSNGELGTGDIEKVLSPKKIMDNVSSVAINRYTLIVKKDGSLWGCGTRGTYSNGTTKDKLKPTKITDDVKSVEMGSKDYFVIKNDNSLWACGERFLGTWGHNETELVKIMDDVLKVTSESTFVIKKDGSLWACGYNSYGELGDGTTNSRKIFVKIMDNVRDVKTDGRSTYIIKKDNTLWSCGYNEYGQLGDGSKINRSTPIKIMDDVSTVSVSNHSWCHIVKNDGSLWACGNNGFGQLGDGTTTERHTPVMVIEGDPSYTGIQDVVISAEEMSETRVKEGIFSISGQRISAPRKGINILNGKKVIVR